MMKYYSLWIVLVLAMPGGSENVTEEIQQSLMKTDSSGTSTMPDDSSLTGSSANSTEIDLSVSTDQLPLTTVAPSAVSNPSVPDEEPTEISASDATKNFTSTEQTPVTTDVTSENSNSTATDKLSSSSTFVNYSTETTDRVTMDKSYPEPTQELDSSDRCINCTEYFEINGKQGTSCDCIPLLKVY